MISYRDLGNYYEIIFLGDNLSDFNLFHKNIKNIPKEIIPLQNGLGYKIHKSYLKELLKAYPNATHILNEYDSIGDTMKLSPFLYQKEAIHFAIDKENALIILPCGSGNLYYIV